MSARADITRRRLEQLEAVVEAARDLLDQTEDASIAATALADRLDDLDAYCERCDDEGVIVRVLGGEPTSPPPVTETPCECEVARILAAKRAEPCLDCLRAPCRCALDEAGDLEDQIDHLLDEEPARA